MRKIIDFTVVTNSSHNDFMKDLDKTIRNFESKSLEVEIQYTTAIYEDGYLEMSALIIGREVV